MPGKIFIVKGIGRSWGGGEVRLRVMIPSIRRRFRRVRRAVETDPIGDRRSIIRSERPPVSKRLSWVGGHPTHCGVMGQGGASITQPETMAFAVQEL